MIGNHIRGKSPYALTLGLALIGAAGRAQAPNPVSYSYTFPSPGSPVIVSQWDGNTSPTGGDPTFLRPQENYSYLLPPGFWNVYGYNNVPYKYMNFTLTRSALQANPDNYNLYCLGSNGNYLCAADIYPGTYTPGNPASGGFDPTNTLNNIVAAYPNNTSATNHYPVVLTPGNYTLVVHGDSNGITEGFTSSLTQPVVYDTPIASIAGSNLTGSSSYFNRPVPLATTAPPTVVSTGGNSFYNVQAFTVPNSGTYLLTTAAPGMAADIFVYLNSFDPTHPLNNAIAGAGGATFGGTSLVASLSAGNTYYFVTTSNSPGIQTGSTGNFTDTVAPATVTTPDTWTGTLSASSPTFKRPNAATPPTAGTITTYYDTHTYLATATGQLKIAIAGSGSPSLSAGFVFAYGGTFTPASPLTNAITGASVGSSGSVTINVTAGTTYTIVTAGGAAATVGTYTGTLTLTTTTAPTTSYTGTLTFGTGPSFTEPKAGTPPTAVNTGAWYFGVSTFTVTTAGNYYVGAVAPVVYTSLTNSTSTAATWTPVVTLYNGSLTASAIQSTPLSNALATATGNIASITLTPGTYTVATAGNAASAVGDYTLVVQRLLDTGARIAFNDTVKGGTISPAFLPPIANGTSVPTASYAAATYDTTANGGGQDPYDVHAFTVPASGLYNFDAVAALTPFWDDYVALYHDSFTPISPLTNVIIANDTINVTGTDAGFRNVQLNAGTTYYAVVTGGVSQQGAGSFPQEFGKYHASLYTGGGQYPPVIPDFSNGGVFDPTLMQGLSATLTSTDTFNVGSLNSVTIDYLYHPHIGDLVATLSHLGTTIELFDRLGRTTATGSGKSTLVYGNYTFVPNGADFLQAAINAYSGAIDPNTQYAPYLNGTPGQSSTFTGDFTAFNGMPVAGDWTLNIQDLVTNSVGFYEGFDFSVTPQTAIVNGTIALEGVNDLTIISAGAPLGTFHVSFRTPGTTTEIYGSDVTLTATAASPNGSFTLPTVPAGTYDINVKGSKNLSFTLPGVVIAAPTTMLAGVTLPAGDANNDNVVDTTDFNTIAGAFGNMYDPADPTNQTTGYDPTADFDFNGVIDTNDFNLVVGEFGNVGS